MQGHEESEAPRLRIERSSQLRLENATIALPCFFASVSGVLARFAPVDVVEFLEQADYSSFLVSAYDISVACSEERRRIASALLRSRARGTTVLLDSGNYESFWRKDADWQREHFHRVASEECYDLCLSYDARRPPQTFEEDADAIVAGAQEDAGNAAKTVVPIVHGSPEKLPETASLVARQLYPLLLAVPERELGDGLLARVRTVCRIRRSLNGVGLYCPLHVLGTGSPVSILAYVMAGADSFDGLSWCRSAVDHDSGSVVHIQHWDFLRGQTDWGSSDSLSYYYRVWLHNLEFYSKFMAEVREASRSGAIRRLLVRYLREDQAAALFEASGTVP